MTQKNINLKKRKKRFTKKDFVMYVLTITGADGEALVV